MHGDLPQQLPFEGLDAEGGVGAVDVGALGPDGALLALHVGLPDGAQDGLVQPDLGPHGIQNAGPVDHDIKIRISHF